MSVQPGWYPDPSRPGSVRWWDGRQWSNHAASGAPVVVGGTEGYAIASLITALVGLPIAPIILGHMARTRIRESGGLKDGNGLAIAGIVIGWLQLAMLVLVIVLLIAAPETFE